MSTIGNDNTRKAVTALMSHIEKFHMVENFHQPELERLIADLIIVVDRETWKAAAQLISLPKNSD